MTNYQNGKVYKIECINGEEGDVYVGSTAKQYLSQRMEKHRTSYKSWKEGKSSYVSAYDLFDKYGIGNCSIMLLETVCCNSRDELYAREGFHIRSLECVNKRIEGRTDKEYRDDNKEQIAEWKREHYKENRIVLLQKAQEHYNENKEDILESHKEHYLKNKEEISKKKKIHYEENKEDILKKVKEWKDKNKDKVVESNRAYNEKHKEKLNEISRNNYIKNKEIRDLANRQYALSHKEAITKYKKEHYEKNKLRLQEKITCECGSICSRMGMNEHKKTISHLKYERSLQDI